MKRFAFVAGCGLSLLFLLAGLAPARAQLVYQEASQGLQEPALDGGDTEFEMADVDGDGNVDLVSVGDHGNPKINTDQEGVLVWLGDGAGTWTHVHFGDLGYGGVAVGDVNGDGLADVAYGIHHNYSATDLGDQLLEVALGDGSGAFWTPWDDGLASNGEDWGMFATDLGDVDGDGDLDIGSTGFGASGGFQVYLNDGDGSWRRSFGFVEGNSSHVFEFGDVNGDGDLDVATAKEEGTVWLNDGTGFFTVADGNLPPTGGFGLRKGPSLGDVDRDGHDDLAYCSAERHPEVWLWRGEDAWQDAGGALPATGDCQRTELHDMDGDGLVDLVTFGSGTVRVYAGDGAGTSWTELASFPSGDSPGNASAFRVGGDVDHNGRPDMVLVGEQSQGGPWGGYQNVLHCFREATLPAELVVRLTAPGPQRRLLAGSRRDIRWSATLPSGGAASVALELSVDGPAGPWTTIAQDLQNDGHHAWRVPPRPTDDARVRVTLMAGGDQVSAVSSHPFTIARRIDPISVTLPSADTIAWSDDLGRQRFHLYRGALGFLLENLRYTQDPSEVPAADRRCDLGPGPHVDDIHPRPGHAVYYLVTAYHTMDDRIVPDAEMAESTLGQDSEARKRPNDEPCPG